ncbi:MAG: hypothetical protein RLZZ383_294 [Pseudomonadota bacterium]|jgi:DNA-binding transcriptional LysR family regulator
MAHFDLNSAQVFVHVAQAGSFRAAAAALAMPTSTVSRRVAELETQLGVQLLLRTTRAVALTAAGVAFLDEAEPALAGLQAAGTAVMALRNEPRGRLRITATVSLGERFLAPIVAGFLEAYPAVDLEVLLTDRPVDLISEGFDVAIRAGELPDSSLVARRIGSSTYRIVGSPSYFQQEGVPERPADLATHRCLRFAKAGTVPSPSWTFHNGKKALQVPVRGRLVSDDFVVLRTAAEQGAGVARLPTPVVFQALRAGRLQAVLEDHAPPATPIHLLHAGSRRVAPQTRAFLAYAYEPLVTALADSACPLREPPDPETTRATPGR